MYQPQIPAIRPYHPPTHTRPQRRRYGRLDAYPRRNDFPHSVYLHLHVPVVQVDSAVQAVGEHEQAAIKKFVLGQCVVEEGGGIRNGDGVVEDVDHGLSRRRVMRLGQAARNVVSPADEMGDCFKGSASSGAYLSDYDRWFRKCRGKLSQIP